MAKKKNKKSAAGALWRRRSAYIEKNGGRFLAIVIAVFLFYLMVLFFQVLHDSRVTSYMVRKGSLTQDNVYRALLLRDEEVVKAPASGTLICLAGEGEHSGSGTEIIAIDETGSYSAKLQSEGINLDKNDAEQIKNYIDTFSQSFDPKEFRTNYDFVHSINSSMLRLSAAGVRDELEGLGNMKTVRGGSKGGYIVYAIDGFEGKGINDLNMSMFDESGYVKSQFMTGDMVDKDHDVFKLVRSDTWQAVIVTDTENAERLKDEVYVGIKFKERDINLNGRVSVSACEGTPDKSFCIFTFNSSMPNFLSDRYTEIEISDEPTSGLKIPNSAIADKVFFTVPKEYAISGNDAVSDGDDTMTFLKQVYLENGEASVLSLDISIYSETEDCYFVDNTQLKFGDVLIKPDSNKQFVVRDTDTLRGVYNINKGYARFYKVNIRDQNSEYTIIEDNTVYGLREYDYIILDADSAVDDEFIYE